LGALSPGSGKTFGNRFSIKRLAAEVGTSPSSLYEHFRNVTAMTPLQFQKQLRLQDARSLPRISLAKFMMRWKP
jgi:AraC-like DNA-binding protein